MSSGNELLTLPLATIDAACCDAIARFHQRQPSDPASCLEIFRRGLVLKQGDAWERLVNGCVGAELRGKLLTHPAWPSARRYNHEQAYLTDTFARYWTWHANRVAAGDLVRLDSFAGLLTFLHRCLNSAILEELRLWAPPETWHKRRQPEEADHEHSRPGFQHWPAPASEPQEPVAPSNSEETLTLRERVRAIWSCARGEREQRVFVLRWHLGYTPKEIAARWSRLYPGEETSAAAISQMLQNILARYYRQERKEAQDADDI